MTYNKIIRLNIINISFIIKIYIKKYIKSKKYLKKKPLNKKKN